MNRQKKLAALLGKTCIAVKDITTGFHDFVLPAGRRCSVSGIQLDVERNLLVTIREQDSKGFLTPHRHTLNADEFEANFIFHA